MISNARKVTYIVVELNAKDISRLLKGRAIYQENRNIDDQRCLVQVYCSQPNEIDEDDLE